MGEMRFAKKKWLQWLDLALVLLCFGLATTFLVGEQKDISLSQFLSMRLKVSNFLISLGALLFCQVVFRAFHLYRFRRLAEHRKEYLKILQASTVVVGGFVILGAVFSIRMFTPLFLAAFWALTCTSLCISRYFIWKVLAEVRSRGHNVRHVLVLGTNHRAIDFATRLAATPELGFRLVGFVDQDWPGTDAFSATGFSRVTDFTGLAEFLRRNVIDEVAIYLPLGSFYRHASEVACLCELHGIAMRFDSDLFGLKAARSRPDVLEAHLLSAPSGSGQEWPRFAKRLLDMAISFALLLLLSPLLGCIALLIKATSAGPVLFFQERIGVNKRRFRMMKFRTMVPDAELQLARLEAQNEVTGPVFKMRNDPRVTPIGRFLRKSSLDELPQLLNVLRGDMSLVGPRPLPLRDYEGFNKDWQRRRFSVRPGITCLWQVGGRSNISFEQWMLLDLQYMDEWSLWLDLKILAKTIPAVLKGAGAA